MASPGTNVRFQPSSLSTRPKLRSRGDELSFWGWLKPMTLVSQCQAIKLHQRPRIQLFSTWGEDNKFQPRHRLANRAQLFTIQNRDVVAQIYTVQDFWPRLPAAYPQVVALFDKD